MTSQIITVEELRSIYSDMHKDAYGFRPSSFNIETDEDATYTFHYLQATILQSIEEERMAEVRKFRLWKKRIQNNAKQYGISLRTYIRWEMQADSLRTSEYQDIEHYFWRQFGVYQLDRMVRWFRKTNR